MLAISSALFGKTPQGKAYLYTLTNDNGMKVQVTNYGAIITSIIVPDSEDHPVDVALGFDNLEQYLDKHPHFGGLIGRYGNRIAGGSFTINGTKYQLAQNNGPNNLHAGPIGFDKMLHKAKTYETNETVGVVMTRVSPHLESGFPGNLEYLVYYTLSNDNELIITYQATTDQTTHVNLTNHSYFNLDGEGSPSIADQQLQILADTITEVNEDLIPTGHLMPVLSTPFDFTQPKAIGKDIDSADAQLALGGGYDHNYVLRAPMDTLELAAIAKSQKTGIGMEVYTTEPGVQLYTGNNLDGLIGKSGRPYGSRSAFCLETQHYPDTPNQDEFPPTLLPKGEHYESQTVYRFGVDVSF